MLNGEDKKDHSSGYKVTEAGRSCWTLQRETFSVAGMGNFGRKVVGGE